MGLPLFFGPHAFDKVAERGVHSSKTMKKLCEIQISDFRLLAKGIFEDPDQIQLSFGIWSEFLGLFCLTMGSIKGSDT